METPTFHGRLALQQRVLPSYRVPFFDSLARHCQSGMSVFAGLPKPDEGVKPAEALECAEYNLAKNHHFFAGPVYLCWQSGVTDWLSAVDPDLLIVEANPRYLSNLRAIRWMRARRRPVLGWGLGAPGKAGDSNGISQLIGRHYLGQLDGVIAYSSMGAASYQNAGVPKERVFVALNSVSGVPDPIPQRESIEGRQVRILFVGRLQRRKRIDSLVRACAGIAANPELWIVGDGPARGELEEFARVSYPSAKFFGELHGEPLDALFDRADLFVLPGTGGLALQQAMAHALPCIAAEGDGTQIDLVRPENGWLIEPGNLPALESALSAALNNPERLQEMGEASWRIVKKQANVEIMVSVFVRAMNLCSEDL
jgi:glycosyltransferase involved in cell wall biosynthesis